MYLYEICTKNYLYPNLAETSYILSSCPSWFLSGLADVKALIQQLIGNIFP